MENEKILKNSKNVENVENGANVLDYFIGLDIGTDSVGYATVNTDYSLCKHRGQPMWGVTLFDAAAQSADRRSFRSARRRLDRRQQRVDLVQELFAKEIYKVDKNFYIKLRESALLKEDRTDFDDVLCGCEWDDAEYHKKYPTIHHLIVDLMKSEEKHDIRYIYLACAWLVAHRGHFLNEMDTDNMDKLFDMEPVYKDFTDWFENNGYNAPWQCNTNDLLDILKQKVGVTQKEKDLYDLLTGGKKPKDNAEEYPFSVATMIKLLAGGQADAAKIFITEETETEVPTKLKLSEAEKVEAAVAALGDNGELLKYLSAIYDCALLATILPKNTYISEVKVSEYNTHRQDLKNLKHLIRTYLKTEYDKMFRDGSTVGYSGYVANFKSDTSADGKTKRTSYEDFCKYVKSICDRIQENESLTDTDAAIISDIRTRIDLETYMPKQVNTNNRVIPHQVYFIELKKILDNAKKHYPFLNDADEYGTVSDKIQSVFKFRIPYFVGPLNKDSRFAWIERKAEGKIYPWNFDDMVDFDKSEQAFIDRMTNRCTYLMEESVLPKNSILYSKFMVLNEINNLKIDSKPISVELKQKIFNELFMPNGTNKQKVTAKQLMNYLVSNGVIGKDEKNRISGIDIEIKSSMRPAFDFYPFISKGVLTQDDAEAIIAQATYTESSARLKKWLMKNYDIDSRDVNVISSKKYSDFGVLSWRLLNGLEGADKRTGEIGTVMHFMWNTNDNLMQIIADAGRYTFKDQIDKINKEYYAQNPVTINDRLDQMGVSNAVKRPVIRTLDILSDIVKIKGGAPEKIFVEMARGATEDQKNKRTVSRKDSLLSIYKTMKTGESNELTQILNGLGDNADRQLRGEALYLYFMQMGRCMYCGKPIEMSRLGTDEYNIDHIWPQAYIKDDSIKNKVLVHSTENGYKGDTYPVPAEYRKNMYGFWFKLKENGLIDETKFNRLIRNTPFTDEEQQGFINRQLVETRQSTKAVTQLLQEKYPDTEIVFVKAGLASEFRNQYGAIKSIAYKDDADRDKSKDVPLVKSRTVNDMHHAHDAYLNIVAGNVYHEKFTKQWYNKKYYEKANGIDGDAEKKKHFSLKTTTVFGYTFKKQPEIWTPKTHLPIVDKVMNTRQMHLTKYQYCKKGGFFDQMPLKAGNADLIPRKKGLDPVKYGGYNKSSATFFVLANYINGKKKELTLVPVALMVADKFRADTDFALSYVREQLGDKAKDITFPLGDRVIKVNTVFSLDGFEVCLSGKMSKNILIRSMNSLFMPNKQIAYIKHIEKASEGMAKNKEYKIEPKHNKITAEENMELFKILADKMQSDLYMKMPNRIEIDSAMQEKFEKLTLEEQVKCLESLVLYFKTNRAGTCDMESIGNSKYSANEALSMNISNWAKHYSDVRIIDRSASGLYEKKSQNLLGLLK